MSAARMVLAGMLPRTLVELLERPPLRDPGEENPVEVQRAEASAPPDNDLLALHLPRAAGDVNELPDEVDA